MSPSILFSNNVVSDDIFREAMEGRARKLQQPSISNVLASRFEESTFFQEYELEQGKILGDGSFSVCRRCRHRKTQKEFAVKIISRKVYNGQEANLLRACQDHPNIVKLIDVFQDRAHAYLVMELLSGGELLAQVRYFTEKDAIRVMRQLASAVQFMHSRGVVHRDLKPENVMYTHKGEDASVKIVDFGFAQIKRSYEPLHTPCYTLPYAAPEVITQQGYDQSCDLWSLGAILYSMLSGKPPLRSNTLEKILFDSDIWQHISEPVREVAENLLTADPSQRLTANALMKHPCLAESSATMMTADSTHSTDTPVGSTSCERTSVQGFQLRDVDGAKLAQRRKLHKRSSSLSSSASTTSSNPSSIQLLRPMSTSTSNATSITSTSPAQPSVFDFSEDKVNEYLSSLSSSSDSNTSRVSLQQKMTARKRCKREVATDSCELESPTKPKCDNDSELHENISGPLTRLRKRKLEQATAVSSDSSVESYESVTPSEMQRETSKKHKTKWHKRRKME